MDRVDHNDPQALLAAYVELSAEILGKDTSDIEVDVGVDRLFTTRRQWRRFSNAHLELAQISDEEVRALMKTRTSHYWSKEKKAEASALQTLAAFSDPADKHLAKWQSELEMPTLRSLSSTYATRTYHPSEIAVDHYPPRSSKTVFTTMGIVALALLVVCALLTWWSCPISEYGYGAFLKNFVSLYAFVGVGSALLFVIHLTWGLRALRREARN